MASETISTDQGDVIERTYQVADEYFAMGVLGSGRNGNLLRLGGLHRLLDTTDGGGFACLSHTTRVATTILTIILHDDVERLVKLGRHCDGIVFAGDGVLLNLGVEVMRVRQSSITPQLHRVAMTGRQMK